MNDSGTGQYIVGPEDPILITGATGFIGPAVVQALLNLGYRNLRAFARGASNVSRLQSVIGDAGAQVQIVRGELASREDCVRLTRDVAVIFHLANGGGKSFPDAVLNSLVPTRNLLDAAVEHGCLRRFVNVSSFAVYSNRRNPRGRVLDESSPVESPAARRGEAYCYAKIKQDELVADYGTRCKLPYVIVRPGSVYGPGKASITGRVGIDTFGIFLHMGGSNRIPLTYVDNCADAIVLAGLKPGVDGEVFNVVDDDLPTSRRFLRLYKKHVKGFRSLYMPHAVSYVLSGMWEWYANWSEGQLPPVFNRSRWHAEWKRTRYANARLKQRLGWTPKVPTEQGLMRFFQYCRERAHA